MTLSLYRQIGATKLPLEAGDVGSEFSLDTIDPVKRSMLALLVAAINAELGGAWTRVVTTIPQMRGTTPVVDSYPYEPTAQRMTERSPKFPALFLHRSGEVNYRTCPLRRPKRRSRGHFTMCSARSQLAGSRSSKRRFGWSPTS